MVDIDPGSRPVITVAGGGQETSRSPVPAELTEALGGETAQSIVDQIDSLARIDSLACTRNPFAAGVGARGMDLGSIDSSLERVVRENEEGLWAERNFGLTPNKPTLKEIAALHLTAGKLVTAGGMLRLRLVGDSKQAGSSLGRVEADIDATSRDYYEDTAKGLDLTRIESYIASLVEAAGQLPSPPALRGLKAIDAAAEAPVKQTERVSRMGLRNPFSFVSRTRQTFQGAKAGAASKVLNSAHDNSELEDFITTARSQGTGQHKALIELLRTEQTREAVQLLGTIDTVQQGLVEGMDQLEGSRLDSALAAEQYLAARADEAKAAIKMLDSSRLSRDAELQEQARRAQSLRLAAALATRRAMEVRRQEAAHKVHHVSEAHDVLIGGRRLKPGKLLKTPEDIRYMADSLSELTDNDTQDKVFEREEAGLIVAILTDHFETFIRVLTQLRETSAFIPSDQARAAEDLRQFDAEAALIKVRNLLHSDERDRLKGILATETLNGTKTVDMIGKTIAGAIRQLRDGPDSA